MKNSQMQISELFLPFPPGSVGNTTLAGDWEG